MPDEPVIDAPTDPPPPDPPADPPPADPPKEPTLAEVQAEAEKWKAQARKHEDRAKTNAAAAKELEAVKASQLSDTEKAVADAKAEGRSEATKAVGEKLAAAEIKAALTGIVPNPADIIEDLNLAKYVDEDGEPDTGAIDTLAKKYAGLAGNKTPADLKQGQRGGTDTVGQLTRDQLKAMSPDQIVEAKAKGQLRELLNT